MDGDWTTPLTAGAIKAQATEAFGRIFAKGAWAMPSFLQQTTDKAGTQSTHFGEEPDTLEEKKLWDLMRRDL